MCVNVIVAHDATVFQLLSVKDDALLVRWDVCNEYGQQAGSMCVMS
jgi:hypothetical protein